MTRRPRPAERVGDVFVITEARWPRRDPSAFAFDKALFNLRLRAETMASLSVVRPASFINISRS